MSVPTEVSQIDFTGNDVATDFAVPFPIQNDEDLVVTLLADGETVAVTQTLGTHYTVSGEGDLDEPSCTVTMITAPPADSTLHIERTVAIVQDTSLRQGGPYSARTHERALDWIVFICQMIWRRILALEALGSLVPTSSYSAFLLSKQFTTDAGDVEDTWPLILDLPAGVIPTGLNVVKVVAVADPETPIRHAVFAHWSEGSSHAVLPATYWVNLLNISGLEADTEYLITFEVITAEVEES